MSPDIVAYLPDISLAQALPFVLLTIAGLLVLALDAVLDLVVKGITSERRDFVLRWVTAGSFVVTGATISAGYLGSSPIPFFEGALRADEFGNLGTLIILFSALAFVLMSPPAIKRLRLPAGELYALLIFSVFGMVLLTVANDLISAFIAIEISSLALYCMAGINRRNRRAAESAFKYFILGAFASAFLVLGIAFLFGATGTTQLYGSGAAMREMKAEHMRTGHRALPAETHGYDFGIADVVYAGERPANVGRPVTTYVKAPNGESIAVTTVENRRVVDPVNPLWLMIGFTLLLVGLSF
jgi:NADH:ubiquinone oxidoreductase subunit 2 (subunit N)